MSWNHIPDSLHEVIQLVGTLPRQNPVACVDISDLDLWLNYPWDQNTRYISSIICLFCNQTYSTTYSILVLSYLCHSLTQKDSFIISNKYMKVLIGKWKLRIPTKSDRCVYKNDFVHCNHKQERWVQYLRDHTFPFTSTDEDTRHLFDWAKASIISHQTLCETIHKRSQSDSNSSSTGINFVSEISLDSQMDFHMLMS